MKFKITIIMIYLSLCSAIFSETLIISFGQPEDSPAFNSSKLIMDELSRLLDNVDFKLVYLPDIRAQYSLTNGLTDGDFARTHHVYAGKSAAIMIDTPIYKNPYVYFTNSKKGLIDPSQFKDLRVVLTRGNIAAEEYADKNNLNYQMVSNPLQSYTMLIKERVDVVIETYSITLMLSDKNYADIKVNLPPLFYENTYMFISDKKSYLKEKIEEGFQKMKESGFLDELLKIYLIQEE